MTAIDVAIICLMAIGLVAWVGEPLVRRESYALHGCEDNDDTGSLLLQKEMLYGAIRDLDFDFQTGKVDQKDYGELRRQLEREAVDVLRQLDAVEPLIVFDNEVERQVIDLRRRHISAAHDSSLETCPSCATPLASDDHFCPSCGQALRLA